jgi:hypothetical protein
MTLEITEGVVDDLRVYSTHVECSNTEGSQYIITFVLTNNLLNHNIYGKSHFFTDGAILCSSESDMKISSLARKRLRKIIQYMALQIVDNLEGR